MRPGCFPSDSFLEVLISLLHFRVDVVSHTDFVCMLEPLGQGPQISTLTHPRVGKELGCVGNSAFLFKPESV